MIYFYGMLQAASSTFQSKGNFLHYYRFGTGKKIVLAFHGFGQNGMVFQPMALAKESCTFYAFDLFFHGKSHWHNRDQPVSKEDWCKLMEAFLHEKAIRRFSLAGFSMGAKFALATLEAFPARVEELILIAPDGIKTNFWYSLATYPILFRPYFKSLITKPATFFRLLAFMKKLPLLDKGIIKFAAHQMNAEEKRKRVYYSWTAFRKLKFDMPGIVTIIHSHHVQLSVYLGVSDKLITRKSLKSLLNRVNQVDLHMLQYGHYTLLEGVAEHLKANE